jgi:hypothetical protein
VLREDGEDLIRDRDDPTRRIGLRWREVWRALGWSDELPVDPDRAVEEVDPRDVEAQELTLT